MTRKRTAGNVIQQQQTACGKKEQRKRILLKRIKGNLTLSKRSSNRNLERGENGRKERKKQQVSNKKSQPKTDTTITQRIKGGRPKSGHQQRAVKIRRINTREILTNESRKGYRKKRVAKNQTLQPADTNQDKEKYRKRLRILKGEKNKITANKKTAKHKHHK